MAAGHPAQDRLRRLRPGLVRPRPRVLLDEGWRLAAACLRHLPHDRARGAGGGRRAAAADTPRVAPAAARAASSPESRSSARAGFPSLECSVPQSDREGSRWPRSFLSTARCTGVGAGAACTASSRTAVTMSTGPLSRARVIVVPPSHLRSGWRRTYGTSKTSCGSRSQRGPPRPPQLRRYSGRSIGRTGRGSAGVDRPPRRVVTASGQSLLDVEPPETAACVTEHSSRRAGRAGTCPPLLRFSTSGASRTRRRGRWVGPRLTDFPFRCRSNPPTSTRSHWRASERSTSLTPTRPWRAFNGPSTSPCRPVGRPIGSAAARFMSAPAAHEHDAGGSRGRPPSCCEGSLQATRTPELGTGRRCRRGDLLPAVDEGPTRCGAARPTRSSGDAPTAPGRRRDLRRSAPTPTRSVRRGPRARARCARPIRTAASSARRRSAPTGSPAGGRGPGRPPPS